MSTCDCHLHAHQVCDICQGVVGKGPLPDQPSALDALMAIAQGIERQSDGGNKGWQCVQCGEWDREHRPDCLVTLIRTLAAEQRAREEAAEDARMGHVRLDECSDAAETKGKPLYDRISAKIQKLVEESTEKSHIISAIGAEKDELRARAESAKHRQAAAEYRAQRIVLDAELLKRAETAEAEREMAESRATQLALELATARASAAGPIKESSSSTPSTSEQKDADLTEEQREQTRTFEADLMVPGNRNERQLFQVGWRVIRPIDLQGLYYRRGVVTGVSLVQRGVGQQPHYFYEVLWDNTTVPQGDYLGSGLTREPGGSQ